MSDFSTLKSNLGTFLEICMQKTNEEKTTKKSKPSDIRGTFKGFNITVNFGSGKKVAKRPLLAFLKDENTISKGVYPLIIFEPSFNEFIVCKGISFDNKPDKQWVKNVRSDVKFKNTKYKDGLRTNSYFRSSYSTHNITDTTIEKIQSDLESIINDYPN